MTLIATCVGLLLALSLAGFAADVAATAAYRARAQSAADAAALAAVAESAIYGGGDPRTMAAHYARLNDAEMVECLCDVGATAVQVEVVVQGVTAEARAVFDPEAVVPGRDAGGLHPLLAEAVRRLVESASGSVYVVSGYRPPARQAELWERALSRYGDPEEADDWVARPGSSMHELGLAVDLGGDLELAARLIEDLGLPLVRPLAHEPWHFELDCRMSCRSQGRT